jgi:hypothetical protein
MRRRDPLEGMSPEPARPALSHEDEIRRRQRSRATVTGLALAAFAILLFAITIVRIGNL